jgi:hypothetical protein
MQGQSMYERYLKMHPAGKYGKGAKGASGTAGVSALLNMNRGKPETRGSRAT